MTVDLDAVDEKRMTWGDVLRMIREERGLTQAQLADLVKAHQTMISHLELGKVQPDEKWARLLDEMLQAGGRLITAFKLVEPYLALPSPNWNAYEEYRKLETQAVRLYDLSTGRLSGLLQTEEYTRALFAAHFDSAEQIEERVRERLARQERLFSAGLQLVSVIDEAVLWRAVGSRALMRDQQAHLLSVMQRKNVVIQVLPFGEGETTRMPMSGMIILEQGNGQRRVYSESLDQGHFIDNARQVSRYVDEYDRVRGEALSRTDSAEVIRSVMEEQADDRNHLDQEQPFGRDRRPVRRMRPAVRYPRRRPRT
ncbi:helix-turn-helix transcriptional regulator [Kitasatospora acidiphila]|uniref:Helix-turn-helix transcriptional regulator n=1 Tax=Kitasatospora acidiphila TaxID=2567942 RepID=A0A540W4B9_9ACTN|nr:helix-turn-helix transcriptional regulator [Kitasatospora acidiphila]TQF03842.1 helix-turn-helix transcriptional regulator [Kitasatospora acidiphila]